MRARIKVVSICLLFIIPTPTLAVPDNHVSSQSIFNEHESDFSYSRTLPSFENAIEEVFSKLYPQYDIEQRERSMCSIESGEVISFVMRSASSANSFQYKKPRVEISIVSDLYPNAFTLKRNNDTQVKIVLTVGLLQLVNNESELAFVLAHEMAHVRLEHFSPHVPFLILNSEQLSHIAFIHQSWEFEADREAVEVLNTAGFSAKKAVDLLERLASFDESFHSHSADATPFLRHHPAIHERVLHTRSQLGLYETQASTPHPDSAT